MQIRILATASVLFLAFTTSAAGQSWIPGPSFPEAPQPRLQGAAVIYLGRVYVLGGSPFDTTLGRNGSTDYLLYGDSTFTRGPVLEGPFVSQGAGVDALGRAVVFGGWTGPNGDRGGTFVFDPTDGGGASLVSRSSLAPPANFAWTTDAQNRIYSLGGGPGELGNAGNPNSTRVERFDAAANTWAVLAPMPVALAHAAATDDGQGHVFVFGGINADASARMTSALRYDVASDTWSTTFCPPLPVALSNARAVHAPDQRFYVIGGVTGPIGGGTPSAAVWVLDQRTNSWYAGPSLTSPRADPAVLYDPDFASVLAMGGDNGAGGNSTSEMLGVTTCPTFGTVAQSETLSVGRSAAFHAEAQGDMPIDYRWRRNGVLLVDGATGTGSIVSGSATTVLTLNDITSADAGAYDLVATNGCGFQTSPAAGLVVTAPPLLPGASDWTVTSQAFSAHVTSFNAVSGGVIAGGADYRRTSNPASGQYFFRGLRWDGVPGDPSGGFPIGNGIASDINGAAGTLSVGYWQYLVSVGRGGLAIQKQGAVWVNVNGVISMQGLAYGIPMGTDGRQIVGTNGISAFVWYPLGPAGPWSSSPLGPGFASACVNGSQYGQSSGHAARWSENVTDLNPAGASASELLGAWGEDQTGDFTVGARHAALWHGLSIGVTDLAPAGSDSSVSTSCSGAYQAGQAYFGGSSHAMIWGSSAAQNVDLGGVAGPDYGSTWARALEVDAVGNLTVVGGGVRSSDGATVGLLWVTSPYAEIVRQPASVTVNAGGDATFTVEARGNGGLAYQWHHDGAPLIDDARVTGSQTALLHLAGVQPSDAGRYDVQVSNALRSVGSTPETLTVVTPAGVTPGLPARTQFTGALPMPVRDRTSFRFDLARASHVSLRLYDVSGRLVCTLLEENRLAGRYQIPWSPTGTSAQTAGLYFARFEADGMRETRRVVIAH